MNLKNIWGTNWQNSGKIDSFTIILGDLNVPLSVTLENQRDWWQLNYTITLVDLPGLYRELHPTIALFSKAHTTLSQIDHTNSHKTSLKNFKLLKSYRAFPNGMEWNGMKLGISKWRKMENFSNMWKLNNTILHNKWIKE